MHIAFYGSSLLSSYWNGAATYYRGLLRALAIQGHRITFYEPDAFDRQNHRDIEPPDWAGVVVYPPTVSALQDVIGEAAKADVVVKASGVGIFDDELLEGVMRAARGDALRIFWDVDAPATLAEIAQDAHHPIRRTLPKLDAVLTYGGGDPVVRGYETMGARRCVPIYNALEPETHHPVLPDAGYACDLLFLGNRLPDREARVEEFFIKPAARLPQRSFLLGGSGWRDKELPPNVRLLGHVGTAQHNVLNASARVVLNVARDSMAAVGFSPATRIFEAAGAGACLMTDQWPGIELFLAPGAEILVARDGEDVTEILGRLTAEEARAIGLAALSRIRRDHTYASRATAVTALLAEMRERKETLALA